MNLSWRFEASVTNRRKMGTILIFNKIFQNGQVFAFVKCVICANQNKVVVNWCYINVCFTINSLLKMPLSFSVFYYFNIKIYFVNPLLHNVVKGQTHYNVRYWLLKNCKLKLHNAVICIENRLLKVQFHHLFIINFI